MATAPPTVGEWNMFHVRFIRLVSKYSDRPGDAGKLTRRLIDERDHLCLFLKEAGVAPTNNHAQRLLRFAVLWRKASFGTVSEKGGRWAERILSLCQTCRLRGKRIFPILVDAMTAFFAGSCSETAGHVRQCGVNFGVLEVAIGQAALGGIWAGCASLGWGLSSAMASTCM